jgi:hypothetical protein
MQSDRRLSAKLVPTFEGRRCHVVRMTDPYGRILGFLDRTLYCKQSIIAGAVYGKNVKSQTRVSHNVHFTLP